MITKTKRRKHPEYVLNEGRMRQIMIDIALDAGTGAATTRAAPRCT